MSARTRFFVQLVCLLVAVGLYVLGARLDHIPPVGDESVAGSPARTRG